MIEVIDKFVGLVNDPDYIHCENEEQFSINIVNNGLDPNEIYKLIKNHLTKIGVNKDHIENKKFLGNLNALSTEENFDANSQTKYRTRVFSNMADYELTQSLIVPVLPDNIENIGKSLYTYELVSVKEI